MVGLMKGKKGLGKTFHEIILIVHVVHVYMYLKLLCALFF